MKRNVAVVIGLTVSFAACASLLGIRPPKTPFEHRAHALEGIRCTDCHTTVAIATSSSAVRLPTNGSCRDCHRVPHDQRPCRGCHGNPETDHRVTMARNFLRFDHREHVPVLRGSCVRCHSSIEESDEQLMPKMGVCLSCHQHDDQFEVRACEKCHVDLPDERVKPSSHAVHGTDFTRNHGAIASASQDLCETCHLEKDCASCHGISTPALPWRLGVGTDVRTRLHRAGFAARHSTEANLDPGACMSCHRPVTCQTCHEDRGLTVGRSPHPPGWVGVTSNRHGIEARRDPVSCASCHSGAGEMLCVDCHKVGGVGGNPHPPGYTSTKQRRDVPCRLCHQP